MLINSFMKFDFIQSRKQKGIQENMKIKLFNDNVQRYRLQDQSVYRVICAKAIEIASFTFPASCRYYPSCTKYARGVLNKHGGYISLLLILRRVIRCNHISGAGFDPIP